MKAKCITIKSTVLVSMLKVTNAMKVISKMTREMAMEEKLAKMEILL